MSRSEAAAGLGGLPEFPGYWCIQNRRKGNIGGGAWQEEEGKEHIGSSELIYSDLYISVWKHWWITYANMYFLFNTFSPVGLKLYCLLWGISQSQHKVWFSAQRTVTFFETRFPQCADKAGRACCSLNLSIAFCETSVKVPVCLGIFLTDWRYLFPVNYFLNSPWVFVYHV